jgi:H+/Cl- antiporter ClcA
MNSLQSTVIQQRQLLGTNLLNEEASESNLANSFPELIADRQLLGVSDPSMRLDGPLFEGKTDSMRSSSNTIGSGIYFRHSAPPGPLNQGEMIAENNHSSFHYGSTMPNRPFDYYPTQQASNDRTYKSYGSLDGPTIPLPPTIDEDDESSVEIPRAVNLFDQIANMMNITAWLSKDVVYDYEGVPFFESTSNWTITGVIRWLFYNPLYPEFTSLQQFCWAVVLGVFMGIFTAGWKLLIDACVEFTWKTFPTKLVQWGFFTDLNGAFPLYHYMWITPGLLSGIVTYISNSLSTPIPTQDDWIHTLHSNGIQESDTFIQTFAISTIGMTSGLSLGPELPLILTAGMIGSCLGRICRQSLLQARVMNLTAAAAAIGGMFGFPLAGGIFVMELPHRMGLQYFEALSPATIASIVAVLINRIVINNDVTGMFQYPFLSESLPSYIFKDAIVYGLFGGALGIFYTYNVKKIKKFTRHFFDCCSAPPILDDVKSGKNIEDSGKLAPSDNDYKLSEKRALKRIRIQSSPFAGMIPHMPTRAALTSTVAGIAVGITGIFLPHVMFWGEAQLQTLIDKRKTPLPIFGQGDDPTADLVALGRCMIDQSQESDLSIRCSIAIVLAKIFVTGLSLGTGIVGGHFWAPLFVGAAATQFFEEFIGLSSRWLGVSTTLTEYPCVALLCIMGATHVVTCKLIPSFLSFRFQDLMILSFF